MICWDITLEWWFLTGATLFKGYVTGREVHLINDGHAGACKAEVDQYCFEVKPGEGRLAKCLQEQLVEQQKSENTDTKVTEACKTELDDFLIDRSGGDILDVSLFLDTMFRNGCRSLQLARHHPANTHVCPLFHAWKGVWKSMFFQQWAQNLDVNMSQILSAESILIGSQ